MSYADSGADHQASSKIPRHKTGTKRHKNLSARPVSFALKTGSIVNAATCNFEGRAIDYSMPTRL
jgi:hypothetical protein